MTLSHEGTSMKINIKLVLKHFPYSVINNCDKQGDKINLRDVYRNNMANVKFSGTMSKRPTKQSTQHLEINSTNFKH